MNAGEFRGRRLIFQDKDEAFVARITDWEQLRKRYYEAEKLLARSGPLSVIVQFVAITKAGVAAKKASLARKTQL